MFISAAEAESALGRLASEGCDVLVVSDAAPSREAIAAIETGERVIFHHIDTSGTLAPTLAAMLARSRRFAPLGSGPRNERGEPTPPPGMQRLFQNLVHHLAAGAAVVIVHAPAAEHQLRVSHALLAAKCDILLTHEVASPADGIVSQPAPTDACCGDCDGTACRRLDPSQDGTGGTDGARK